jgi:hypothetical protein
MSQGRLVEHSLFTTLQTDTAVYVKEIAKPIILYFWPKKKKSKK